MVINANVAQPSPGRLSRLIEWSRGAVQNKSAAAKAKIAELAARTYSAGSTAFASIKSSAIQTYQDHPNAAAAGALALGAGAGYYAGLATLANTVSGATLLLGGAYAKNRAPEDIKSFVSGIAAQKYPRETIAGLGAAGAGFVALTVSGALPALVTSVGTAIVVGKAIQKSPFSDASSRMLLGAEPEPLPADPNRDWDSVLEKVSEFATRGERGANDVGAKPDPVDLREQIQKVQPANLVDPNEITEALDPESRASRTDWGAKMEAGLAPLANEFSTLNTLIVMKKWAGNEGMTESQILQIAGNIQSGSEQRSLWQIFRAECKDLTLFQKLKAGIAYLLFYQTGLMHRIMFTLVNQHFTDFTNSIHAPSDAARVELFHKFLMHGNQLLAGEQHAVQAFVDGVRDPHLTDHDLQAHRKWVVANRYGFDLAQFCRDTSKRMLEKNPPKIPFFTSLHNIPILGSLSTALESGLNSLIRSKLQDAILPEVLQTAAEKSAELTEPYKLKFAAKATEMMILMLETLRKEIPNLGKGSNPLAVSPVDQQQVRTFVKQLIQVLRLKGKKETKDELRAALAEQNLKVPQGTIEGVVDQELEKILEVATFEGINQLFNLFNDMSKSKELSARLLDLSQALFEKDDLDPIQLKERYDDAQSRLNDVSSDLIDRLVKESFKKLTEPDVDEDPNIPIQQRFDQTKQITVKTLSALKAVTDKLPEKVGNKTNVQDDLATAFRIFKEFSTNRRMRGEILRLKEEYKGRLGAVFTPVYREMEQVAEASLRLQGAQGKFSTHTELTGALDRIRAILGNLDPNVTPSSLSIGELSVYRQLIERSLPKNEATVQKANDLVQSVQEKAALIGTEATLAAACNRLIDRENPQGSLLVQWKSFQSRGLIRNLGQPFRHEQFRKEVRDAIQHLPEKTKTQLNELIGNNGSKLASNWDQVARIIEELHREATTKQMTLKQELSAKIVEGGAWIDRALTRYKELAVDNYGAMERESAFISQKINELSARIPDVNLPDYNGRSPAERGKEQIRIGFLSFPPVADKLKELVAKRIQELSVQARLLPDPYLALGVATRLYSELGK